MKNLIYLIFLWNCTQSNKKTTSISYEIEVINKKFIEMKISNNTKKNYFFAHPRLFIIKTSNKNKNILTEDIVTEVEYNYKDFRLIDNKKSNNQSTISISNNCNSIFLVLKKEKQFKLKYEIKNSEDLSSGNYSIIVDNLSCNIDSIKKKIPIGYLYYPDSLSIPRRINIQ